MSAEPLPIFAITAPGLESLVAAELRALGQEPHVVPGGVEFTGDARALYAANLELRSASRVVVRIAAFRARTFFELERHAKKIAWERYLAPGSTVALRVTARKSKLYHEGAIAERLLKFIEQRIGSVARGEATALDDDIVADAGQLFIIRFVRDECVVSVDASGALLHMRGYRQAIGKAPLRETLAASLVHSLGWRGAVPFADPMCGSGTIPIEAALLARRIPPGLARADRSPRAYAFQQWPIFDDDTWTAVVAEARSAILAAAPVAISGSDRDAGVISAARSNAERAGVENDVAFEKRPLSDAGIADPRTWLVTNPPYGVRVGGGDVRDLYAAFGRLTRERAPEGRAAVLTPDPVAARHIGLPLDTVLETRNGGIAVKLLATLPPVA